MELAEGEVLEQNESPRLPVDVGGAAADFVAFNERLSSEFRLYSPGAIASSGQ